jgi:hypothetical protein
MSEIAVGARSQYSLEADVAARPARRPELGKLAAAIFSIALIGAMLSAVVKNWQERPRDSFPLSYFPMFTADLDDLHTEHYVVGTDALGRRYAIHYNNIAPGGSMPRVRGDTRAMVRRGQAEELCQRASTRLAERNTRSLRSVVRLEVMTGTFSLSEYLKGNKVPVSETLLASCPVSR